MMLLVRQATMKMTSISRRPGSASCCLYLLYLSLLAGLAALVVVWNLEARRLKCSRCEPTPAPAADSRHEPAGVQAPALAHQCQTIQLAVVCGGFNSTRGFYTLLKSILFYRNDPIELHLFVDHTAALILGQLFRTWRIPNFRVHYYNMSQYEASIAWITSVHYSHHYGLIKLLVPEVLSRERNLSRLLTMDTDMLALGDIGHIWRQLAAMQARASAATRPAASGQRPQTTTAALGLVENRSDWYLSARQRRPLASRDVWPAMGRGYNTGLMLLDLQRLMAADWPQLWRKVAEMQLTTLRVASLADQDIVNAVIKQSPDLVYDLPCSYNVQLNDHAKTKLDECVNQPVDGQFSTPSVTVVHWNSPNKIGTQNPQADYYRKWYHNFKNWSGHLLERNTSCRPLLAGSTLGLTNDNSTGRQANQLDREDSTFAALCKDIRPAPKEPVRTLLFYYEFELDAESELNDHTGLTIVVHLSFDRLQLLDELADHWPGPISAAIYLSELELDLFEAIIEMSSHLFARRNIGYHLVFRDHGLNYPINRLRNIALDHAMTPYVFLSDIDFLPSTNLYTYLRQTIAKLAVDTSPTAKTADPQEPLNKHALVVPAFENIQYKFEFPANKAELITQLDMGSVNTFRAQLWPQGHAATDYARWRIATRPYRVEWEPEYEPFVVLNRLAQSAPRFDERFVGFGWNKVQFVMQLAALNYELLVIPEAFVVHKFHSPSYDIMQHRSSSNYRSCIRYTRKQFLLELKQNHPAFFEKLQTYG